MTPTQAQTAYDNETPEDRDEVPRCPDCLQLRCQCPQLEGYEDDARPS